MPQSPYSYDEQLTRYIATKAKKAGVNLDTYDPDFIVAVVEQWLAANQCVLTPNGVKRLVLRGLTERNGYAIEDTP